MEKKTTTTMSNSVFRGFSAVPVFRGVPVFLVLVTLFDSTTVVVVVVLIQKRLNIINNLLSSSNNLMNYTVLLIFADQFALYHTKTTFGLVC